MASTKIEDTTEDEQGRAAETAAEEAAEADAAAEDEAAEDAETQDASAHGPEADEHEDGADEEGDDEDGEDREDREEDEDADGPEAHRARGPVHLQLVEAVPTAATRGMASAVFSLVAGALALASLSGTWLGTMLSDRRQLIGQIHATGKSAATQVKEAYGAPWHTLAGVNGVFAVVALVIAAVVLAAPAVRSAALHRPAPWVRAVAWAALILAVVGLVVAALMYFDLAAALPKVPATSSTGTGATG